MLRSHRLVTAFAFRVLDVIQDNIRSVVSDKVIVRPLRGIEASTFVNLYERSMFDALNSINKEFSRMVYAGPAAQQAANFALTDPDSVVVLAYRGKRPVGLAVARKTQADAYELQALGVVPEERGRNTGVMLYEGLIADLHRRGGQALNVRTPTAQNFFRRCGASEINTARNVVLTIGMRGFSGRGAIAVANFQHRMDN